MAPQWPASIDSDKGVSSMKTKQSARIILGVTLTQFYHHQRHQKQQQRQQQKQCARIILGVILTVLPPPAPPQTAIAAATATNKAAAAAAAQVTYSSGERNARLSALKSHLKTRGATTQWACRDT